MRRFHKKFWGFYLIKNGQLCRLALSRGHIPRGTEWWQVSYIGGGGFTFKSALLPPYPHFLSLGQLSHSHRYQNEPKLNWLTAFAFPECSGALGGGGLRCWGVATAAILHGGPWVPGSDATLVPASLSLSDAMAKGRASKLALISSARSVHRSAALRWACPSA